MKCSLVKKIKQNQSKENLELKSESVSYVYYKCKEDLNEKYLPPVGDGDNMANQSVTALNMLITEWYDSGEVYDNRYLNGWDYDISSYANWLYKYVADNRIRNIMFDMINQRDPNKYEYGLKLIHDYIMDEKLLSELEKSEKKGNIYCCVGPFSYEYDAECYD